MVLPQVPHVSVHVFREILLNVLLVLLGSDANQFDGLAAFVSIGCIQSISDLVLSLLSSLSAGLLSSLSTLFLRTALVEVEVVTGQICRHLLHVAMPADAKVFAAALFLLVLTAFAYRPKSWSPWHMVLAGQPIYPPAHSLTSLLIHSLAHLCTHLLIHFTHQLTSFWPGSKPGHLRHSTRIHAGQPACSISHSRFYSSTHSMAAVPVLCCGCRHG